MLEFFKRYCLIGIACTIVCKALFLYPLGDVVFSQEAEPKTFLSITSAVDNNTYAVDGSFVEEKVFDLGFLAIWEGEETDEDEKSDDSFQRQNSTITALEVKNCDALNSLHCFATIPLFILFHSWKSFLL